MTIYRSIEELEKPQPVEEIDDGRNEVGRRDFLKLAGFSVAAVAATACQRPEVTKAIPYLTAPEEIVPGRTYQIASTCHGCAARCGILVRCRDGRPIKIEGNPDHPLSRGGLCAVGQASVLSLYDSRRLGAPLLEGKEAKWSDVDAHVAGKLASARNVRVLTSTLASPMAKRTIDAFLARFENGKHVVYDVPSLSAIAEAHEQTHGVRAIPHFRFDKADVIVSFDADFLGTWLSPVEFTKQWVSRRGEKSMNWHTQIEGRMSLTGSKADQRLRVDPRHAGTILAHLADALGAKGSGAPPLPVSQKVLDRLVERLRGSAGRSLVVSGSERVEEQLLVNSINEALGNYQSTLDLAAPSQQREGNDRKLAQLIAETSGLDALFVLGCNPVYDLANGDELAKLLASVPLVVTFASHADETSKHAHVVCPDHHFLEAWGDSEPVAGLYAVTQPAIAPIRNTRAAVESFAVWSGNKASAYELARAGFDGDWEKTLHDGYTSLPVTPLAATYRGPATSRYVPPQSKGGFSLVLYPTIAMLDGRNAHNAWLHELPDPVTKLTWDNHASFSPAAAKKLGIVDGDVVDVSGVELPAFVQPGQHDDVIAIPIGYGRIGTDRFANVGPKWILARTFVTPGETIGRRVVQLARRESIAVRKSGRKVQLATTQLHNSMEGRDLVREMSVGGGPEEHGHHVAAGNGLWPKHAKGANRWGLAIDLSRCTGCSGCVIACQAENNVPVVGRDEVVREREMHWIRIDRYYEGEGDDVSVVHQPMMCAHCGNAPCESVCPVLATVHSTDGLNQQVYNRCVGTRYCANNCPYKARRFNWFDYPHDDRFASLVLNPDVTVRSRGVMEKCSMCVQRIEEARIVAKQRGLPIADGAIQTACQQSCPADAIVFGDLNDPKSRISKARADKRHYTVLEELNVQPAVGYLRRLVHREASEPEGKVSHV